MQPHNHEEIHALATGLGLELEALSRARRRIYALDMVGQIQVARGSRPARSLTGLLPRTGGRAGRGPRAWARTTSRAPWRGQASRAKPLRSDGPTSKKPAKRAPTAGRGALAAEVSL